MDPDPEFEERIGTTLCGKWQLIRLLGHGGMAAVYLAEHHIGRREAIKILHPRFAEDEEMRGRFLREARAVNRFRHPSVVEVRDVDVDEVGTPFMVMEHLQGQSLDRLGGSVSQDQLMGLVDELLDVLDHAHREGIIHRDIKPANLFVCDDGRLKVLDFGVAKMSDHVKRSLYTQDGAVLGTAAYMPPEQIRGADVDARADLYAVGATLFRLLTKRHVHQVTGEAMRMVVMATNSAPPLREVAPTLDPDLARIVDRALAFDRDERYPDAATMRADVQAFRRGEPLRYATGERPAPRRVESSWNGAKSNAPTPDPSISRPRDSRRRDAEALVGITLEGGYQLQRLLGRGGMGGVYAARTANGDEVAVKVLLTAPTEETAERRFDREARTALSLQSPHVVRVHEAAVDRERGLPFIVMDLLHGSDLEKQLSETKPLHPETVLRIFRQACEGVRVAHHADIIHRDLKPANIFLHRVGDEVEVKICDFGLAKRFLQSDTQKNHSLTQSGGVLGTPRYASPEQATNAKRVDQRSDLWGLCLSMYEALSGRQPWSECESIGELIVAIVTTDLPPLRQVAPWVDPELAAIVDRGLARDMDARWASVDEILDALRPLVPDPRLTAKQVLRLAPAADAETTERGVWAASQTPVHRPATPRPLLLPAALLLVLGGAVGWLMVGRSDGEVETRDVAPAAPATPAAFTPEPSPSATTRPEAPAPRASVTASPSASAAPESRPPSPPRVAGRPPSPAPRVGPPPAATPPAAAPKPGPAPKPDGLKFKDTW